MGNSLTIENKSEDFGSLRHQDEEFSNLQLDVLFNPQYLSAVSLKLPEYPGTEVNMHDNDEIHINYLTLQFKSLFSLTGSEIASEDFQNLSLKSAFLQSNFLKANKIRARLLLRMHEAYTRLFGSSFVRDEINTTLQARSIAPKDEPHVIFSSLAISMCLTLSKHFCNTDASIAICLTENIIEMLKASGPLSLAHVKKSNIMSKSLQTINQFSIETLKNATGALKSQALALLLCLAAVLGSVNDLVTVAKFLRSGEESLPGSVQQMIDAMIGLDTDIRLSDPYKEGAIDKFHLQNIGSKCGCSLATDGVALILWNSLTKRLYRINSGFHGTLAGDVTGSSDCLDRVLVKTTFSENDPVRASVCVIEGKLFLYSLKALGNDTLAVFSTKTLKYEGNTCLESYQIDSSVNGELKKIEVSISGGLFIESTQQECIISIIRASIGSLDVTEKFDIHSRKSSIKIPSLSEMFSDLNQESESVLTVECVQERNSQTEGFQAIASNGKQLIHCQMFTDYDSSWQLLCLQTDIVIESAFYYTINYNQSGDVTQRVIEEWTEYLKNNSRSISVENELFGDTSFGNVKTLFVNFRYRQSDILTCSWTEHRTVVWSDLIQTIRTSAESKKTVNFSNRMYEFIDSELALTSSFTIQPPPGFSTKQEILNVTSLLFNGSKLTFQQKAPDTTESISYVCYQFDVRSGKLLSSNTYLHSNKKGFPDALCYDGRNNMIWAFDETNQDILRWRNVGLSPNHIAFASSKTDTITKRNILTRHPYQKTKFFSSVAEDEAEESKSYYQSAMLMSLLEYLSLPYSPPPPDAPDADSEASSLIEVVLNAPASSGGENSSVGSCDVYVKGQVITNIKSEKGYFLITLDDNYDVMDSRSYDNTVGTEATDRLGDFIDGLPDGQLVILCCNTPASLNRTNRVIVSVNSLGAINIDKVTDRSTIAVIGRKGSPKGSACQTVCLPDKTSRIRQKIPILNIPLKVEVSNSTIISLIDLFESTHDNLLQQDSIADESIYLSCMRVISVTFYNLIRGCSDKDIPNYVTKECSDKLIRLLSDTLNGRLHEVLSTRRELSYKLLSSSALNLFVVSLRILYPTSIKRLELFSNYADSYFNKADQMNEKYILELILSQFAETSHELIFAFKDSKPSDRLKINSITDFLKLLLKILTTEIFESIQAYGQREIQQSFQDSLSKLLVTIFKHLLSQSINKMMIERKSDDLFSYVILLTEFSQSILSSILDHDLCKDSLPVDIDMMMKRLPIFTLLPSTLCAVSHLITNEPNTIHNISDDDIASIVKSLSVCQQTVSRIVKLLKYEEVMMDETVPTTNDKVLVYESPHPYLPSLDEYTDVSVPGATSMIVTFDSQTRTEHSCDYLTFLLPDRSSSFHPGMTFSGRDGTQNFPGYENRPSLEIPGSKFVFYFHSDGSVQDWGYKFTVTAKLPQKTHQSCHWIESVNRQLIHFAAVMASSLIQGEKLDEAIETNEILGWMDNSIIRPGLFRSSIGKTEEDLFLLDFTSRPVGSLALQFIQHMKKIVKEDQGSDEVINRAVYSSCAAIIKLNGLTAEALAVAKGFRSTDLSSTLQKAWKSGQKMRNYFQFSDMVARSSSITTRRPSLYAGASEDNIAKVSDEIVNLAHFLLRNEDDTAESKESDMNTPITAARRQWNLVSKINVLKRQHSSEHSTVETRDKWNNLVTEVVSTDKLKSVLAYRRILAQRNESKGQATVTEKILNFLQSNVSLTNLERINGIRNYRARRRLLGIDIISFALQYESASPFTSYWLVISFSHAFHIMKGKDDQSKSRLHYLTNVEGCSPSESYQLTHSFARYLTACVNVIGYGIRIYESSESSKTEKDLWMRSIIVCLRSCAFEYDFNDHVILSSSGLLSILKRVMRCGHSNAIAVCETLLEVLAKKCLHVSDNDGTNPFGVQLIELLSSRLEKISNDVMNTKSNMNTGNVSTKYSENRFVFPNTIELSKIGFSYRLPCLDVKLNHSISFYIWRPHCAVDSPEMKIGSYVCKGPAYNKIVQDELIIGEVGEVIDVQGDMVSVQWNTSKDAKNYKYNDQETQDEIVIADKDNYGLIYMKGAPGLLRKADDNYNSSWSYFGMSLLPDMKLCFFAASGDKIPFTLIGSRIPAETWTHVTVTQFDSEVSLFINDQLNVKTSLSDTMKVPGSKQSLRVIESTHPYSDNLNTYEIIDIPGAKRLIITFDERSATELSYDFITFYECNNRSNYYGDEKYSGGRNGSQRKFPGVDDVPPLVIPTSKFELYFHSDGSNNDWGYKIYIQAEMESSFQVVDGSKNLNDLPWYFGQIPGYTIDSRTSLYEKALFSSSCVAFVNEFNMNSIYNPLESENTEQTLTISRITMPSSELSIFGTLTAISKIFNGELDLLQYNSVGKVLPGTSILSSLLNLYQVGNSLSKCTILRLFGSIIPVVDIDAFDVALRKSNLLAGPFDTFMTYLIRDAGSKLNVWYKYALNSRITTKSYSENDVIRIQEDGTSELAISMEQLKLIRTLAKSGPILRQELMSSISRIIDDTPEVLVTLNEYQSNTFQIFSYNASIASITASADSESIFTNIEEIFLNVSVRKLNEIYGALALLGGQYNPLYVGSKAIYNGQNGIGEDCYVLGLEFPPRLDPGQRVKPIWEGLAGYGDAVRIILLSQPDEELIVPYHQIRCEISSNEGDDIKDINQILGVEVVSQFFHSLTSLNEVDERPRYKDKLAAPSDESKEPTKIIAPPLQVLPRLAVTAHLKMICMKSIKLHLEFNASIIPYIVDFGSVLFQSAIAPLPRRADEVSSQSNNNVLQYDSPHPYRDSMDEYTHVKVAGAKRLIVTFDVQSSTEANNDYVRFYKDRDGGEVLPGADSFSGGLDGSTQRFPGIGDMEPYTVMGDEFVIYFHSDSSVTSWGYRIFVTPVYADESSDRRQIIPIPIDPEESFQRSYHIVRLLYDNPKIQPHRDYSSEFELERSPANRLENVVMLEKPTIIKSEDGSKKVTPTKISLVVGLDKESISKLTSEVIVFSLPFDETKDNKTNTNIQEYRYNYFEEDSTNKVATMESQTVTENHNKIEKEATGTIEEDDNDIENELEMPMSDFIEEFMHERPRVMSHDSASRMSSDEGNDSDESDSDESESLQSGSTGESESHDESVESGSTSSDLEYVHFFAREYNSDADESVTEISRPTLRSSSRRDRNVNPMYQLSDNPTITATKTQINDPAKSITKFLQSELAELDSNLMDHNAVSCTGYALENVCYIIAHWPDDKPMNISVFGSISNLLTFIKLTLKKIDNAMENDIGQKSNYKKAIEKLKLKIGCHELSSSDENPEESTDKGIAISMLNYSLSQLSTMAGLNYEFKNFSGASALIPSVTAYSLSIESAHPYLQVDRSKLQTIWEIRFPVTVKKIYIEFDPRSETMIGDHVVIYNQSDILVNEHIIQGRSSDDSKYWPGQDNKPKFLCLNGNQCKLHFVVSSSIDGQNEEEVSTTSFPWGFSAQIYGIIDEPNQIVLKSFKQNSKLTNDIKKSIASQSKKSIKLQFQDIGLSGWILETISKSSDEVLCDHLYSFDTFNILKTIISKFYDSVQLELSGKAASESKSIENKDELNQVTIILSSLIKGLTNYLNKLSIPYSIIFYSPKRIALLDELVEIRSQLLRLINALHDIETEKGLHPSKASSSLHSLIELFVKLDDILTGDYELLKLLSSTVPNNELTKIQSINDLTPRFIRDSLTNAHIDKNIAFTNKNRTLLCERNYSDSTADIPISTDDLIAVNTAAMSISVNILGLRPFACSYVSFIVTSSSVESVPGFSFKLSPKINGYDENCCEITWINQHLFVDNIFHSNFGPKLFTNDVITLRINSFMNSIEIYRNFYSLGLLFGGDIIEEVNSGDTEQSFESKRPKVAFNANNLSNCIICDIKVVLMNTGESVSIISDYESSLEASEYRWLDYLRRTFSSMFTTIPRTIRSTIDQIYPFKFETLPNWLQPVKETISFLQSAVRRDIPVSKLHQSIDKDLTRMLTYQHEINLQIAQLSDDISSSIIAKSVCKQVYPCSFEVMNAFEENLINKSENSNGSTLLTKYQLDQKYSSQTVLAIVPHNYEGIYVRLVDQSNQIVATIHATQDSSSNEDVSIPMDLKKVLNMYKRYINNIGVAKKANQVDTVMKGDLVIRRQNWDKNDEDGGEGNVGEVVDIVEFEGIANSGVYVKWNASNESYLYEWKKDLQIICSMQKTESKDLHFISMNGNAVEVQIWIKNENVSVGKNFNFHIYLIPKLSTLDVVRDVKFVPFMQSIRRLYDHHTSSLAMDVALTKYLNSIMTKKNITLQEMVKTSLTDHAPKEDDYVRSPLLKLLHEQPPLSLAMDLFASSSSASVNLDVANTLNLSIFSENDSSDQEDLQGANYADWIWIGPVENKYLSGYAFWRGMHQFLTLSEAMIAAIDTAGCKGITYEPTTSYYTLRCGDPVNESPCNERSWLLISGDLQQKIAPVNTEEWQGPYQDKYLSGYCDYRGVHEFTTLEEAQRIAAMLYPECRGITNEGSNKFTLRKGHELQESPTHEVSYLFRPSLSCLQGHPMEFSTYHTEYVYRTGYICDICRGHGNVAVPRFVCRTCTYDVCSHCQPTVPYNRKPFNISSYLRKTGEWSGPYHRKYLEGYVYWNGVHDFPSLDEAKKYAVLTQHCGGITQESAEHYTLRKGSDLIDGADQDVSWILTSNDMNSNEAIEQVISVIDLRYKFLVALNTAISTCLPYFDLRSLNQSETYSSLLNTCRGLIFESFKKKVWEKALSETRSGGGTFELKLSRSKARKFSSTGKIDMDGRFTVFSQAFRTIHSMNPELLRRSDKIYTTIFIGEQAQDAGGPYRESFGIYMDELQSPVLPLLLRSQNGRQASGTNREKWIFNPDANTITNLEMFSFVGKLMGIAIRSKEYLSLNLPSIIWKLLVNETLTRDDFEGIDYSLSHSLEQMRNIDEESFNQSFFETFTTISSNDKIVELIPNGSKIDVTYENRHQYCDLVLQYHLHEFDLQAAAVRQGIATIVPLSILSLFTWDQLEIMVCGVPDVDVNLLESVTDYSSCRKTDQHIQYFWQALREFTNEERSALIRFVWGRSRLPLEASAFSQRFKIQRFNRSPPDNYLPVSHTCFFSLELPQYTSLEVMKEKLRYAIFNCQAIDGDDTAAGIAAAAMGWEE